MEINLKLWMKYGLDSEADAINKYQDQTNQVVCQSGLWVNPRFPHLACSPDVLIGEDGLLESLKIFNEHSTDNVIKDKNASW